MLHDKKCNIAMLQIEFRHIMALCWEEMAWSLHLLSPDTSSPREVSSSKAYVYGEGLSPCPCGRNAKSCTSAGPGASEDMEVGQHFVELFDSLLA